MKKGRLSKAELYYIQNTDIPAEDIAKDLDRSIDLINKYLPKKPKKVEKKDPPKKREEPQMVKNMGRHKRKGEYVSTVMTPAASELADAQRPQLIASKKIQEAIFKPKG